MPYDPTGKWYDNPGGTLGGSTLGGSTVDGGGTLPTTGTWTPSYNPGSSAGGTGAAGSNPAGGGVLQGTTVKQSYTPGTSAGTDAQSGGRFVNFGTWFGLNKDNANRQANQLGDVAESAGTKAADALTTAQGQFGDKVAAGTQTYGGQRVGALAPTTSDETDQRSERQSRGDPGPAGGTPTYSAQVNPGGEVSQQVAQTHAATPYGGPASLADSTGATSWSDMLAGASRAAAGAKQLGTGDGRQAAISQFYGNTGSFNDTGGGTSGNSRLDSALTGVAGQSRFDGLGQKFGGLTDLYNNAQQASTLQGAKAKQDSADASAQWGNAASAFQPQGSEDTSAQAAHTNTGGTATLSQMSTPGLPIWDHMGISQKDWAVFVAANPETAGTQGSIPGIGTTQAGTLQTPDQWVKAYNAWKQKQPGSQTSGGMTSTPTRNP